MIPHIQVEAFSRPLASGYLGIPGADESLHFSVPSCPLGCMAITIGKRYYRSYDNGLTARSRIACLLVLLAPVGSGWWLVAPRVGLARAVGSLMMGRGGI